MDPNAPILFFDSGVGGLSVLGPTRALLPNAAIVYAADSAGFPYGTRTDAELAVRVWSEGMRGEPPAETVRVGPGQPARLLFRIGAR